MFGPAVTGYFFDDDFGVVSYCQTHTWHDISALLTGPTRFRILYTVWSWLQVQVFGAGPAGYKVVSIMAYGAIVLIVHRTLLWCGARGDLALLGALVFALMPEHHRPAYYMTRPLDYLWAVVGVWCLVHPAYPRRWWLGILGSVLIGCGLFAYEANLSIGSTVVAIAILRVPRDQPWLTREFLARVVPVVVLTLAYAVLRFVISANLTFYYDVTGTPQTVLAEGPAALLLRLPTALAYAAASHTHLLRASVYPVGAVCSATAVVAAFALCFGRHAQRPGGRAGLLLGLWWAGTLVPFVDGLNRVDPESQYLFLADWPLVATLTLFAAPPTTSTRARRLWIVVLAVVGATSLFNAWRWHTIHRTTRHVVESFVGHLPKPPAPRRVHLLDAPRLIAGWAPFSVLRTTVLVPVPSATRSLYHVNSQLDLPHDPPLRVGATVPETDPWPVVVLRWRDDEWSRVPIPAWARPAVPGAPDVAAWKRPRNWERVGWHANAQLAPVPQGATHRSYITRGRFSLLTGPPLPDNEAPIAWAVVTMTVQAARQTTYGDWLFLTASDPVWDARKVVRFRVEADGEPHTYAVPILAHPRSLLEGPVTRVALRPTGEPNARVRIDAIRLVPVRSAAAP